MRSVGVMACTGRVLRGFGSHGPLLLVASLAAGAAIGPLPDIFRHALPFSAFLLTLGSFLTAGLSPPGDTRLGVLPILCLLWTGLGVPLVAMVTLHAMNIDPILKVGMLLAALAPPVGSAAAIASLLGLQPRLALICSIVLTMLCPLSIPGISALIGSELPVDMAKLGIRLAAIIAMAALVAALARQYRTKTAALLPDATAAAGIAAIGLMIVGATTASNIRGQWLEAPSQVAMFLSAALGANIAGCALGAALFSSWGKSTALTVGLVSGNRNVTLAWAAAGTSLPVDAQAFVAASVVPVLVLPLVLRYALGAHQRLAVAGLQLAAAPIRRADLGRALPRRVAAWVLDILGHEPQRNTRSQGQSLIGPGHSTWTIILVVFLPFVAGYHLSYLLRVINTKLAPFLIHDLGLDAASLGLLTGAYFLTFALAQIPLGFALDQFGPRRVQGTLLMAAGVGTALCGLAHSVVEMAIGRGLIGLGMATALMAGIKANALWFPLRSNGLANGLFIALGAAGAIVATYPLEWALTILDWRGVFFVLAGATFFLAAIVLAVVPEPVTQHRGSSAMVRAALPVLLTLRFWNICLASAITVGGAFALQGLWIARWLEDVAKLNQNETNAIMLVMASTTCVAAAVLGFILPVVARLGAQPYWLLGSVSVVLMLAEGALGRFNQLPIVLPVIAIAVAAASTVLVYTIVREIYPVGMIGLLNGVINMFNMGGAFAIQAGFGAILVRWPQDAGGHYPADAYWAAMRALIVLQLFAVWIYFARREQPR